MPARVASPLSFASKLEAARENLLLAAQVLRSHLATAQAEQSPETLSKELGSLERICRQHPVPPAVLEEIQRLLDALPDSMVVMMKEDWLFVMR